MGVSSSLYLLNLGAIRFWAPLKFVKRVSVTEQLGSYSAYIALSKSPTFPLKSFEYTLTALVLSRPHTQTTGTFQVILIHIY